MFTRRQAQAEPAVITLNEGSPVPKYQQIVDQVRALVASGALAPGAQIPSVRQLATDLSINTNTVLAAYRELEAEHVVVLRRGSRAIIHPRFAETPTPGPQILARIQSELEHVRVEAVLAGISPRELLALATEVFSAPQPSHPPIDQKDNHDVTR